MAWTALTFALNSLLTSTKMTQLYDNITAQANADSGAPKNVSGSLSTSTTSLAGSISGTSTVDISLTAYSFFPMIHTETIDVLLSGHSTDGASADSPRLSLYNGAGSLKTYDIDYRYVAS